MRKVVFYSWQSDIAASLNRNLIQAALEGAIRGITNDPGARLEPVLERDTAGVPGSPSITETIFAKIAAADLFVADVTIISQNDDSRPTPNPNVLTELGFAAANLGWDRIILVQNTAFGGPELLPFDLRGRRVIQYEGAPAVADKRMLRGALRERLTLALRSGLEQEVAHRALRAGPDVPLWWGRWSDQGRMFGRHLFIYEVGANGFRFELAVFSGAHTGEVIDFARFQGPNSALALIALDGEPAPCELNFRRSAPIGRLQIDIEESGPCQAFRGIGAFFGGTVYREPESLFLAGKLDEQDLARLHSISGKYFEPLMDRCQQVGEMDNLDEFPAKCIACGVRGLYTIMEAVILLGPSGRLWAAYIDDDVVRYFTTEGSWKARLPLTLEKWRERFGDKRVVYDSTIDYLPTHTI
jgi:hypothetical protein